MSAETSTPAETPAPPTSGCGTPARPSRLAVRELLAGAAVLPAQLAAPNYWSPEKSLAAAVLATALIDIRDHYGNPKRSRAIADDLAWIRCEDNDRLCSFLRICELLDLDPGWVRACVDRWCAARRRGRPRSAWRGAA